MLHGQFASFTGFFKLITMSALAVLLVACGGGGSTPPPPATPGTLQFSAATYSGNEDDGAIVVTVTRTGGSLGIVTVDLTDALDGTATLADSDYTAITPNPTTLTWADGDNAAQTINVTPTADGAFEPDETVNLTLTNITGGAGVALGTDAAVVTILNDDVFADPGTVQFSPVSYTKAENDIPATATITVTRTGGDTGAVTVDYQEVVGGTATPDADYTAIAAGTLSWADGESGARTFDVAITNDTLVEPDETVNLSISIGSGAATLGVDAATLTITSEDAYGSLQFNPTTYTEAETGGLTATITVTRTGGSSGLVTVDYATSNGTATAGSDYTAAMGTLSWPDGNTADQTFAVDITNDTAVEVDETVNLSLTNAQGGATLGTDAATLTITSEDAYGTLQFNPTSYNIAENGSGTATITVTRTGGSSGLVTVDYATSNGSATAGSDYTAAMGTLSWADGVTADRTFDVAIINDTDVEVDETVNLSLTNAQGGATLGTDAAILTIASEDVSLQFSPITYTESEVGSPTANITVTRIGSVGAASVNYAVTGGTAASGSDYTAVAAGTLNWVDGDTSDMFIPVPILDDTLVEDDETVILTLSTPSANVVLGNTTATLTITSEDAYGTLQFSSATYSVDETPGGAATTLITLQRVGGSSGAVSVNVTDPGTGSATGSGTDYTLTSPTTVSWTDGDTADKNVTITIVDDGLVEGAETVELSLGTVTGGASIGTPSASTITINDDEAPPAGDLQFTSTSYSVNEDGINATITVERINGSNGAVGVTYATSDNTAIAGSDYTATTNTLSWADGDTADKSFTVSITNDAVVEVAETVSLALSSATGGASVGGLSAATLTIEIDDTNLTMDIGDGSLWVAFQDGPGGTWTEWFPTSGNTYDFPVTDGSLRYGVAFHRTEGDGSGRVAQKTYVIHATVGELPSLTPYSTPKHAVSGTLSNYTGANDSAVAIMQLNDDGHDGGGGPYDYSLPKIGEGLRDFIAVEEISTFDGPPSSVVMRRNINITGPRTINVDFTNDADVQPFAANENSFSGTSAGQQMAVFYATANGTSVNLTEEIYDGFNAVIYPYLTMTGFSQTGDSYSFQMANNTGTKYRVRNKPAVPDPGTQSFGMGSFTSLTGTTVNTTQTTGLSYSPNAASFSGQPLFMGFMIGLDQTVFGVTGGATWDIRISDGWLGGSTTYTHPSLIGINGFDSAWNLQTGIFTDTAVSAVITKANTVSLRLILLKTLAPSSLNLQFDPPVILQKLSQKDTLKLDVANEYGSTTW